MTHHHEVDDTSILAECRAKANMLYMGSMLNASVLLVAPDDVMFTLIKSRSAYFRLITADKHNGLFPIIFFLTHWQWRFLISTHDTAFGDFSKSEVTTEYEKTEFFQGTYMENVETRARKHICHVVHISRAFSGSMGLANSLQQQFKSRLQGGPKH